MERITAFWNKGLVGKATIILVGLVVSCCVIGAILGPPAGQQTAGETTSIPSVTPSLPATSPPEPTPYPTLTAEQRSAFQAIAQHAAAMKAAGEQLIELGQDAQPATEDVRAAAQTLIDSQKAIVTAQLPDWYSPLSERAASVTGQCAAAAEAILKTEAIAEHQEVIQRWCITEMGRLQLQAENP